jgi:hypoxanthine phosphoribosyltransferase
VTAGHRVLADATALRRRIVELGAEIGARHPEGVVVIAVLNGSVLFAADLVRELAVPVQLDFVAVTAYRPEAGRVRLVKDVDLDVSGRAVVLVHDVVHTGLTTAFLLGELRRRGAASVEVCALVDRDAHRLVPVEVTYAGFGVGADYVVGMGLDHHGRYRNLHALVAVDDSVLAHDPDALVGELYRGRGQGKR